MAAERALKPASMQVHLLAVRSSWRPLTKSLGRRTRYRRIRTFENVDAPTPALSRFWCWAHFLGRCAEFVPDGQRNGNGDRTA